MTAVHWLLAAGWLLSSAGVARLLFAFERTVWEFDRSELRTAAIVLVAAAWPALLVLCLAVTTAVLAVLGLIGRPRFARAEAKP